VPRILLAVIVYDGREVVPPCLDSAVAQHADGYDIDVLVLDDCSPSPGFSEELEALCRDLRVAYHRNVRNLGIPRNMSLGLQAARAGGYEHIVLCNSDVVLGRTCIGHLAEVADRNPAVGSVTAWSNNVSIFSLGGKDGPAQLDQEETDRIDASLWRRFGHRCLDIPTGVGFCLLLPVSVVAEVGVLDPVFGRGYCEEVDWCQRARLAGYRNVLALGCFAFHHGSVSTRAAGVLAPDAATDWTNEAIVDLRYADYRELIASYLERNELEALAGDAVEAVVVDALRDGYDLVVGDVPVAGPCLVVSRGGGSVVGHAGGFTADLDVEPSWGAVVDRLGRAPTVVFVRERGPLADRLVREADAAGVLTDIRAPYPQLV
jgi:GT2 family glycosyltransferase